MYKGHKNRAAWSTSVTICDDAGLLKFANDCLSKSKTITQATYKFLELVGETQTSHGFAWSHVNVRSALKKVNNSCQLLGKSLTESKLVDKIVKSRKSLIFHLDPKYVLTSDKMLN